MDHIHTHIHRLLIMCTPTLYKENMICQNRPPSSIGLWSDVALAIVGTFSEGHRDPDRSHTLQIVMAYLFWLLSVRILSTAAVSVARTLAPHMHLWPFVHAVPHSLYLLLIHLLSGQTVNVWLNKPSDMLKRWWVFFVHVEWRYLMSIMVCLFIVY